MADEDENSNILSVKEENFEKNIEQMQMLNKEEKNKLILSPEEQFKNYPNYIFFKCFGISFCKMGSIYSCNFDINNQNSPKICIGPQWYLAIFSNVLITGLVVSMYYFLVEANCPIYQKIIYFIISFMVYYNFDKCALVNPGIIQNQKYDNDNIGYCSICQVYYNPNKNVEHCSMCDICIENIDHHCIWVGKCVGKNNRFSFYAMLGSIGLIYAYIILLVLFQYSSKLGNKKSKQE